MDKLFEKATNYYFGLRQTYEKDFHLFCKDVMGFSDMNSEHEELCKFLQRKSLFKLVLMPRYTFKSCVCTVAFSLWNMFKNPNTRILIYSDATSKAQGFLTSIKNHIEGKAGKWRFYFGNWETDSKKGKWNESMILTDFRTQAQAEPTIETAGIETSLVGRHYDLIIFDDIVSDKNVTTKEQMDKVAECYRKALSLLRPGGQVVMVGTIWHFGDLYRRLIVENEGVPNFLFHRNSGYYDDTLLFESCGLTKEFLDKQLREQGSYLFSCLYENNPVSAESAIFKSDNFSFYGAIKPTDLYITGTLDPAGEGKDKCGLTVVGTDHKLTLHILEAIGKQLKPSEMIDLIIALNYRFKFNIFGLETIFFRRMLRGELQRRIFKEHQENPGSFSLFSIEEFDSSSRHGKGKFTRMMALQPYHERGAIKFPGDRIENLKGGFSDLAHQMLQFTPDHLPEPNDLLDSLADHIPLIRKGGVVKKQELPRYSGAWLERKSINEQANRNRHLPRRLRKRLPSYSFS